MSMNHDPEPGDATTAPEAAAVTAPEAKVVAPP